MMKNKNAVSILAASKLKSLRISQGYKIHDIAQKLNKSDQQLFRYEHGINKIDLETIIHYLTILDYDLIDFFSAIHSEINQSSNETLLAIQTRQQCVAEAV